MIGAADCVSYQSHGEANARLKSARVSIGKLGGQHDGSMTKSALPKAADSAATQSQRNFSKTDIVNNP
jgi:hypothetical protein